MKQIWKLGLLITMVLVMALTFAGQADAASGFRRAVLFPQAAYANGDSTYATTVGDAANWFDWRAHAALMQATGFAYSVSVEAADADIDTIQVISYMAVNKASPVTIDTTEIAGTLGTGVVKSYTTDSTYGFYPYHMIIGSISGDAAGTAIQTVGLRVTLYWFNKFTGSWVDWKSYRLNVPFQE